MTRSPELAGWSITPCMELQLECLVLGTVPSPQALCVGTQDSGPNSKGHFVLLSAWLVLVTTMGSQES